MNSEHINAQHQTKRGKETFLSFYLLVACNNALCKLNPRSVQLVARNRQSCTEVEFPCSVQLVARKNTHKNHRTSFRPFWWRAFPNACLLYQSVIGTRCEACAIKSALHSTARWNLSCIKMHATIWNNAPRSVQLVARIKNAHKGNHSCIKMHATWWPRCVWWINGGNKKPDNWLPGFLKRHLDEFGVSNHNNFTFKGQSWKWV